jgi:hypothetical protein
MRSDIERREPWSYGEIRKQIKMGYLAFWAPVQAMAWWNMEGACSTWSIVVDNKLNCLWGAITTSITAGLAVMSFHNAIGHIGVWMDNNGVVFGGLKRGTVPQGLLDELADMFGVDSVSHHGIWQYNPPVANGTYHKRQQSGARDVFTFNKNGMDHHFAYLGNHTTTGAPMFKLGFGPPKANTTLRLRGRSVSGQSYNEQYFSSGGIDFKVEVNPDSLPYPKGGIDNDTDYDWFYDQTACIMSSISPNGQGNMQSQGMWFQIYDEFHGGTMASIALAPFTGGSAPYSVITEMEPEGGLKVDSVCGNLGSIDTTA